MYSKNELKPCLKQQWCIGEVNGAFVACMEDVLDLYAEPYDPKRPKVSFDETSRQLIADKKPPTGVQQGKPSRRDYGYERKGTRNLLIHCEAQTGWRQVEVTERRTKHDFAHQMKRLVDERCREAEVIRVILDNLNTRGPGSFYETFEPVEARRPIERLEFHYRPKQGSWLNMGEIELSILQGQCLSRRIDDEESLKREVAAWEQRRNDAKETMDRRFLTTDAREKLKRLYPTNSLR